MPIDLSRFVPRLPLIMVAGAIYGQDPMASRDVLRLTPDEVRRYVEVALESEFSPTVGDDLSLLAINRGTLVIPLLTKRIEIELQSGAPADLLIAQLSEIIAYAGDENALLAIDRLMRMDSKRFGGLVGRALTHSSNWYNPFHVAYRALDQGASATASAIVEWARDAQESERMIQFWSEALTSRGLAAREAEDPILSRLSEAEASMLRERLRDSKRR